MAIGSAAAKVILFGEHAVVYGRPALAVPLCRLRAVARVEPHAARGVVIHSRELAREYALDAAPADDPLAAITRSALAAMNAPSEQGLDIWIESDIPLAGGLGSGAAVSTAIVRALAAHFGRVLSADQVSELVFATERLYHGTPSGIDNTVIALEQPIHFDSINGPRPIHIARAFSLLIAQTGIATPTRVTVGDVRQAWEQDRERYELIFDEIGEIVDSAERALAGGQTLQLGDLMNRNQELLRRLDVSSAAIENLLRAGLEAGAVGGKLSGGGRGGNVIFCSEQDRREKLQSALLNAHAKSVISAVIEPR